MQLSSKDVSVIISVYKDTESLAVVLASLANQTVDGFEIIISEDGESEEMRSFLAKHMSAGLIHVTQADNGWRKNRVLNKSVQQAKGNYLIFLDGDCVPNSNLLKAHTFLAKDDHYLLGRRVFLGESFSNRFKNSPTSFKVFEKNYLRNIWALHRDGVRHFEDGIVLPLNPTMHKISSIVRGTPNIVCCHFSCFKEDLLAINGFDEDYPGPGAGEDEDIVWRFSGIGLKPLTCRNFANVFHLNHAKRTSTSMSAQNKALMFDKMKERLYRCSNGIVKEG